MPTSTAGEEACSQIAENEADDAADERGGDVADGGEVIARAEEERVLQGKGGQCGVAAAESRHERGAQVRGFHEPVDAQRTENPHEQAASVIDKQRVPGHIYLRDTPFGGDEHGGYVAQHTAQKAAAAHIHHCSERKFHIAAPIVADRCYFSSLIEDRFLRWRA